jgi:hypothetical protein
MFLGQPSSVRASLCCAAFCEGLSWSQLRLVPPCRLRANFVRVIVGYGGDVQRERGGGVPGRVSLELAVSAMPFQHIDSGPVREALWVGWSAITCRMVCWSRISHEALAC